MEMVLHDPHKTTKQKDIIYSVSENGCHICISHSKDTSGYPIRQSSIGRTSVARYVWYLKTGQAEIGISDAVMQTCKNRDCINPEHIYLADRVEQNRRKIEECKAVRHSGLTDVQIYEIKTNIVDTSVELAKQYNVSDSTIRNIWKERTFYYIEVENYKWYVDQRRKRLIETRINQTTKANRGRRKV